MSLELRFSLPNQPETAINLSDQRMLIGTLPSNEIVIRAPGVDPIHAMIENNDKGEKVFVDLGSTTGATLNGRKVEIEAPLANGDRLQIGNIEINIKDLEQEASAAIKTASGMDTIGPVMSHTVPSKKEVSSATKPSRRENPARRESEQLFSPRKAKPRGDVLEVVSYWGDTILDVELFHPRMKGFEQCTIGNPSKAHMLAGGKDDIETHLFAVPRKDSFKIYLLEGMKARIRRGGEVLEKKGPSRIKLDVKDIAHISYDAVKYFILFVKPPPLDLPPNKAKDPLFATLLSISLLLYFIAIPFLWMMPPIPEKEERDDAWTMVNLPEKKEVKPKPKPKPKTKPEKKPKPKQKVAKKKTPPPPKPPKPKPKKVVAAKPTKKPVTKPTKKPVKKPKAVAVKSQLQNNNVKKPVKTKKPTLSKLKNSGLATTKAFKPNFKLAGAKTKTPVKAKKTGGARGSGMKQKGAPRKGKQAHSIRGVEGARNRKSSGVNLKKLGLGVGKIHSKTGPSARHTNFRNSVGGAGGGSGSAARTLGLGGGIGNRASLGISGSAGALNRMGSGAGGPGSGLGGSGGLGTGFGRGKGGASGRANVVVPPGDPVVSGGLTSSEVQAVIRANLNQIRHCYEKLLQRSPSASGKVKVRFKVSPNGRVASASIASSTIADSRMKGCVTSKVKRWRFPNPRGGKAVTVTYPFVFNPL